MICPYCRTELGGLEGGAEKICEGCGTPHHEECFAENGGCTVFGCRFAPPDEPKIHLQPGEFAPSHAMPMAAPGAPPADRSAMAFTGFGDVRTYAPVRIGAITTHPAGAGSSSTPPPPPPSRQGATEPAPVLVDTAQPVPEIPVAAQEVDATRGLFHESFAVPPKRRSTYIVLGLLLGIFGAHSFYAGYRVRGTIQLCLTVLTLGYGALVTAIWTLVEICTVKHDSNHVEFS